MRVHPAQNQAGSSVIEQVVYHTGASQTEQNYIRMVKQDIVIVTCENRVAYSCAEKVRDVLTRKTRLNDITCFNLRDPENDKFKTQCGKVLFLLSDRNQTGLMDQILSWIHVLQRNNHNKLKCFFVSLQKGNIDHQVSSIEYENENNSFVVSHFEAIFQWWPQFLREMLGSNDGIQDISFRSVQAISSSNSENQLAEFVKQEFSVYEDNESELENINKIIVFIDGPIDHIQQELKQSLRNSKLNGADIYLYALENETFQGNTLVNKISTRHYTTKSEMDFLTDVFIDFGIIQNKLKLDSCKRPEKPSGMIQISNLQESSVFLVWGEQDIGTSAGTNIVIRKKIWYDGKWMIVEENLPGYINGYEVKQLDTLNQMYIFSVVRENDSGVSYPLVSEECSLMQKQLDIATMFKIIGLYMLIGLVLFLNILQSFIGLAFVVFLIGFAVGFYMLYCVLSCLYQTLATTRTEEVINGSRVIIRRPPSSDSMHSEVCECVGGICTYASRLFVHACFGNVDRDWEYWLAYGTPITIGLIASLGTKFNGIVLAVFFILLIFGVGWCIIFHYVLTSKFQVKNGVYGLANDLKEKVDGIHPYKFRQKASARLQTIQVETL